MESYSWSSGLYSRWPSPSIKVGVLPKIRYANCPIRTATDTRRPGAATERLIRADRRLSVLRAAMRALIGQLRNDAIGVAKPCRRLAHETHEPHENQTDAPRFMVLFSPPFGEIKTGLIFPGTASFRVIRVSWATPIASLAKRYVWRSPASGAFDQAAPAPASSHFRFRSSQSLSMGWSVMLPPLLQPIESHSAPLMFRRRASYRNHRK